MNSANSLDDILDRMNYEREAALRIYLGGSPGVGKTYRMLQDGNTLKNRGLDVVVGFVETHGRAETATQLGTLEIVTRKRITYRDREFEEMDTDAIIARNPRIVLIDELAHTNVPGSNHEKRYQDIEDVLAAGIAVFSTCNVQHLESVHDIVERLTGVEVQERVPDTFFGLAKEVIMVDVSVEELQERLKAGKIYKPEKVELALANFFTRANISLLREMALREVANDLEQKDKEERQEQKGTSSSEKVMVAITDRTDSKSLIRFGSRMSGRINAKWYVVYVNPPKGVKLSEEKQTTIEANFALARLLGAKVVELHGSNIANVLRQFAFEEGVTQIVLGATQRPWWQRAISRSVVSGLLKSASGIAIHVFPLRHENESTDASNRASFSSGSASQRATDREIAIPKIKLTDYLPAKNILPGLIGVTTVEQTIAILIDHLIMCYPELSAFRARFSELILQRERLMSTFLDTGIAIPHAAGFNQINDIRAVMALAPQGVISLGRDQKASIVLLFLSPEVGRSNHLKFLAATASVFLDSTTVREIAGSQTAQEAHEAIVRLENTGRQP